MVSCELAQKYPSRAHSCANAHRGHKDLPTTATHQISVDHSTQHHHEPCHLFFPIRSALSQFAARLSPVYERNISLKLLLG
jgi:hypothetical protein